jgi:hypothetical protein
MALTLDVKYRYKDRSGEEIVVEATFDSSYATGGESLTAADLGVKRIEHVSQEISSTGHVVVYDYANSLLKAYYGNYDAADGPLIEVPNGTNLSAVVARLIVKADHFAAIEQ